MILLNADMIYCLQYSIISLLCMFSLIYFIIVTNRSAEHSNELLFYKITLGLSALCALGDIFYGLREFGNINFGGVINYLSEIFYSLGSILGAYGFFVYAEHKQVSKISKSSKGLKLLSIPFIIMSLITITTPIHKLNFYFDGSNYVRGILNIPFTIISSIYFVVSGVSACIRSFKKKYHSKAVMLRLMLVYTCVLAAAQILQLTLGSILPFRTLFATVVFMVITLRGMTEIVTIDALSNLNNRFALNKYLDNKLLSNEEFYLLMIDIDKFKHINDEYGHVYGDKAITLTARSLINSVPPYYFVGRFGGDEFIIISSHSDESIIKSLETKIQEELNRLVKEDNIPFSINITLGYAKRDINNNDSLDIISRADKMLYDKKALKNVKRIDES